LYDPCELDVVEAELPVSTFFNVIDTPDTTAAVGSVTTPAMAPVVDVCAQRLEAAITANTKANTVGAHENLVDRFLPIATIGPNCHCSTEHCVFSQLKFADVEQPFHEKHLHRHPPRYE
jgi:hypothetical protein